MKNSRTAVKGKEIVDTVALPDCNDDVEDDEGIADVPRVPSHNEAYILINKLTMVGGAR